MKRILIILISIFINFTVSAETLEVQTVTDAINYSGDKSIYTKLVIKCDISGENYLPDSGSEWGKIRTLDAIFPNIEALTLLTSQDMPPYADVVYADNGYTIKAQYSLFYADEYDTTIYQYVNKSAQWLREFNAPNITTISEMCFAACENLQDVQLPKLLETGILSFTFCNALTSVDFPELIVLEGGTFYWAGGLTHINAPKVKTINSQAFYRCYALQITDFPEATLVHSGAFDMTGVVSVNFPKLTEMWQHNFYYSDKLETVSIGTGFEIETEVKFINWGTQFDKNKTPNIDLILGEFTLPKREGNRWNGYTWKSITVGNVEYEEEKINVYYIGHNKYYVASDNISEFLLYDLLGNQVKKYNNNLIDLNYLPSSIYFIQCFYDDKKPITIKLIKN